MTRQYIAEEVAGQFQEEDLFDQICELEGEVFRAVEKRRTLKTRIGDHWYFAKIHFGVGWWEIIKNLLQGRAPVLGAGNEWRALRKLQSAGVPSMQPVVYHESGINPAAKKSAILTRALEDKISLEDYSTDDPVLKRALIMEIARMTRQMHAAGLNHRDYYLCHFLMDRQVDQQPVLHLIDLHRAQIRSRVPDRWQIKDLGGLLFSAFDKGLTRRDLLRFLREYRGAALREVLPAEAGFWRKVRQRAVRLYLQDHDELPGHIRALLEQP